MSAADGAQVAPGEAPDRMNATRRPARQPITGFATAVVILGLSGLAVGGCGGSSRSSSTSTKAAARAKSAPVCRSGAGAVIAREVGRGAKALTARATTGSNSEPECDFRAPGVSVAVNIDSSPQPYQRLERTIDEAGQQFGTVRNFAPPVTVPKLGLDAAWLPDESKLLTTDGRSLLAITVGWRGEHQTRQIALATLVARQYLGKPIPAGAVPTGEV